jgi:hypothetical protein
MRSNSLGDGNATTLEASVVSENANWPVADPSEKCCEVIPDDITDVELSETAECLFIGSPQGSPSRHVLHAAAVAVLAAVTLATWLPATRSNNQAGPAAPSISAAVSPQAAPAFGQASARSYAPHIDPLAAYGLFCQKSRTLCALPAPIPSDRDYAMFCVNSVTLCTMGKTK